MVQIDRISNLPDPILHHILSFLSTKEAARSSVLSKRWVNLWATLPSLVFDSDGNKDNFEQFVNHFFCLRESLHLDSFRISCKVEPKILKSWLVQVVKLQPRSLYLKSTILPLALPGSIFRCESLEELILDLPYPGIEPVPVLRPKLISLSHLKHLEIWGKIRVDDQFMSKLISNCALLEELFLWGCKLEFSMISSDVLKELDISSCHHHEMICIRTPNLLYLELSGFLLGGFELKDMISLVTAKISFQGFLNKHDYLWGNPGPNKGVLRALSNVTHLELHGEEVLPFLQMELYISAVFTFENLRSLYCWVVDGVFYPTVRFLNQHTPNLEKLTLHYLERDDLFEEDCINIGRPDDYFAISFPAATSFHCPYLEKIEIIGNNEDISQLIKEILASNEKSETTITIV